MFSKNKSFLSKRKRGEGEQVKKVFVSLPLDLCMVSGGTRAM